MKIEKIKRNTQLNQLVIPILSKLNLNILFYSLAWKLNTRAPSPDEESTEEQNSVADVQNADDSFDSGEEDDIAMRVMQESAEPLPVRHDNEVRQQGH